MGLLFLLGEKEHGVSEAFEYCSSQIAGCLQDIGHPGTYFAYR